MDLTTLTEIRGAHELDAWRPGDAWLAGGTFLFSQPQPGLNRLLDLGTTGWPPIESTSDGLQIAATCTITELARLAPPSSRALFQWCCRSFSSSFKVWNVATVGGNLCLALPAGPMIALTAALAGVCVLIGTDGRRRSVAVTDFVIGNGRTALADGEMLRSVRVPAAALEDPVAFRGCSLRRYGRPSVMVIGRRSPAIDAVTLTVTASTTRPLVLRFDRMPTGDEVADEVSTAIPEDLWLRDAYGLPEWRRQLTLRLAEEVRRELSDR
ncbi:FAD binding domain-containing protein [Amycolatopsis pithecellobii]|uniref:FAD-binding molybdopterin dehydrogenase n=1 Tax=Amycolatopsis pithecellobii TaxID=664692 RepID=A0A6N7YL06_9PSEU|nr:FAD binding domain-containing protein [Amycolatopsis pithecellobii]MTD52578.1 FAD-binding molybdopterin dehydrogenase [Amycolatopsis pithecellobii]